VPGRYKYVVALNTAVFINIIKSFVEQAPGVNIIKLNLSVNGA